MLAVDIAGIAGVIILVAFVWREATREVVQIDPISVPPSLAEDGFTGVVLAQRLMDHIVEIQIKASTTMRKREVGLAGTQADFVVPGVGFSVGTAAGIVGEMLGTQRTRVRGEVTRQGDLYILTLRIDGRAPFVQPDPVARQDLGKTLKSGAEKIVRIAEPYVLASYYYDSDKNLALAEADRIIQDGATDVESLVRAHNLRGLIYDDRKQTDQAIECYRAAIEIDPEFTIAYGNLALALEDASRFDEALAVHRDLVRIERSPTTYNNLARLLASQGDFDEAIGYYREALALDASIAVVHNNLGDALRLNKQIDEAIRSFHEAIKRDRAYAAPHFNLGLLYRDQGKTEEAIASLQRGIEINPQLARAHLELGYALDRLALDREAEGDWSSAAAAARDACDAVRRAIALEPDNTAFAAALDILGNGKGCAAS